MKEVTCSVTDEFHDNTREFDISFRVPMESKTSNFTKPVSLYAFLITLKGFSKKQVDGAYHFEHVTFVLYTIQVKILIEKK